MRGKAGEGFSRLKRGRGRNMSTILVLGYLKSIKVSFPLTSMENKFKWMCRVEKLY